MTKFLDLAGLTALWNKIKNTFIRWEDTSTATTISIDSTPTSNSTNLITSGGVYGSIPKDYKIDYSKMYLTFEAIEDGTFSFSLNALQYSIDNGSTWTTLSAGTSTPTISAGNKIMWKQTGLTPGTTYPNLGIGTFSATGNFKAYGNVMSLYYGDNFIGQINLTGKNYALSKLFSDNILLKDALNLILPSTILVKGCYSSLFNNCTSLTTAPVLPATTLSDECYQRMFYNCTSLTTAPILPATILASSCYNLMFYSCSSLIKAPVLPATTLYGSCYQQMFQRCTSLTKAPELPATTLVAACYTLMFSNCYSLRIAPELPATTLADFCYSSMFTNCISLNYIKCLATYIPSNSCTDSWVIGVSSSGTFIKAASMLTAWTTGNSGIPSGWNIYTKDYTLVDSVSHTFVKNVTTSAGEKGEPQLRMWIDDYGYRSEIAHEYGYSDWESFLDGYVFGSHEDDDYAGANPFTYYGQTITLDGETYYLWEYDYLDEHESNFAYLITDTVDYDDLEAISLVSNYSNSTCPYVAVLSSDMEIYRTPSNDEYDDVLVMITEL